MNPPSHTGSPYRNAWRGFAASLFSGFLSVLLSLYAYAEPAATDEFQTLLPLVMAALQSLAAIYAGIAAIRVRRVQGHGGMSLILLSAMSLMFSGAAALFAFFVEALIRF